MPRVVVSLLKLWRSLIIRIGLELMIPMVKLSTGLLSRSLRVESLMILGSKVWMSSTNTRILKEEVSSTT